jgi:protein-disulfide isomerase
VQDIKMLTGKWSERLSNAALVAALTFAGFAAFHAATARRSAGREHVRYEQVANWQSIAQPATRLHGSPAAAVTLTLFSDYQCPACTYAHHQIAALERTMDTTRVRVVLRHFPLTALHPAALEAALALECAAQTGRAEAMDSVLFERQQDLGTVPWSAFARSSGIQDTLPFVSCLAGGRTRSRVEADIAEGRRLNIMGTPTIFVNAQRVNGAASARELDSLITRALSVR